MQIDALVTAQEAEILKSCKVCSLSFDGKKAHGHDYLVVCAHGHIADHKLAQGVAGEAPLPNLSTSCHDIMVGASDKFEHTLL